MWPFGEDEYTEDEAYPRHVDSDKLEELRKKYEYELGMKTLFGNRFKTGMAYVVFDEATILSKIDSEVMISECIDDMHDIADTFREADNLRWTDFAEWNEVEWMDTLFDIRSLDGSGQENEVVMFLPTAHLPTNHVYRRRHGDQ